MKLNKDILEFCMFASRYVHKANILSELNNVEVFNVDNIEGILGEKDGIHYVIFRGSNDISDWIVNFKFWKRSYRKIIPYEGTSNKIKAHCGFITSYKKVRSLIHDKIKNSNKVICTGHSLGGVLAEFAALDIQYNFNPDIACVPFATPRPGNNAFAESFDRRVPDCYRFIHGQDVVTKLPPFFFFYKHVGVRYQLGEKKWYKFFGSCSDHKELLYYEHMKNFEF